MIKFFVRVGLVVNFILGVGAAEKAAELNALEFVYPEKDLAGKPAVLENGRFKGDHLTVEVVKGIVADLTGDGKKEGVAVVAEDGGGSGVFYYLCYLKNDGGKLTYSDRVFLGDRVEIAGLKVENTILMLGYFDHEEEQAKTGAPRAPKWKLYHVREHRIVTHKGKS